MHTLPGRTENLLATCSLALTERVAGAAEQATGLGAGAPAALVAVSGFLGGQSVTALANVLGLSHAGTVRLVDRLQAQGLIERRRGDADAREVRLVATRAGRAAAQRVLDGRRDAMAAVLAALSEEEVATLVPLLERMLAAITAGPDSPGHICRLCDADACGHPEICPVTLAAHG
ncbi:MAG TPA: MarR family transcriptional regulator [Solirubrobacter sp.]|nr:MarR family transcriptional regulator [Solirubrobacter sp.]